MSGAWWESGDNPDSSDTLGGYVNPERVDRIRASSYEGGSGTVYVVIAHVGGEWVQLRGAYANESAAEEASRLLCQGVDPRTITGGS